MAWPEEYNVFLPGIEVKRLQVHVSKERAPVAGVQAGSPLEPPEGPSPSMAQRENCPLDRDQGQGPGTVPALLTTLSYTPRTLSGA